MEATIDPFNGLNQITDLWKFAHDLPYPLFAKMKGELLSEVSGVADPEKKSWRAAMLLLYSAGIKVGLLHFTVIY